MVRGQWIRITRPTEVCRGQINCGYFLDELTMENGPIVIVPGSHRAPFKPPEGHPVFPDQKFVLAKPRPSGVV